MMTSGIKFERGDIVIIPFPFTDLSSVKQRPVLVLSNNSYNTSCEDFIVCGITSNVKSTSYAVEIANENLEIGTIPIDSRKLKLIKYLR